MTERKTPPQRGPGRPRRTDGESIDVRVRMPPDLLERVEAAARDDERSRDAWIRRALEAALSGQGKSKGWDMRAEARIGGIKRASAPLGPFRPESLPAVDETKEP